MTAFAVDAWYSTSNDVICNALLLLSADARGSHGGKGRALHHIVPARPDILQIPLIFITHTLIWHWVWRTMRISLPMRSSVGRGDRQSFNEIPLFVTSFQKILTRII